VGVAEVVEADRGELVLTDEAAPGRSEGVGVEWAAVAAVDDQVGVLPLVGECDAAGVLVLPVLGQEVGEGGGERDRAAGTVRFWLLVVDAGAGDLQGLADTSAAVVGGKVGPAECRGFRRGACRW
jgi:hypothetical protein